MRHFAQPRIQRQVRFLRQQFLQDGDLPFADELSQTASQPGIAPRSISFKVTLQVLVAFQPGKSQQAQRGFDAVVIDAALPLLCTVPLVELRELAGEAVR